MYIVIATDTYNDELEKWPKSDREAAEIIPSKLAVNPYVGDPLGYRFLREKKVRERRLYFLVYEDLRLVLMVATSGKKNQESTIHHIKNSLDEFRIEAERISKQVA
mgnify:CR=1 FL=1